MIDLYDALLFTAPARPGLKPPEGLTYTFIVEYEVRVARKGRSWRKQSSIHDPARSRQRVAVAEQVRSAGNQPQQQQLQKMEKHAIL